MKVNPIFKPLFQDRWSFLWIFLCNFIGALFEGASFGFIFLAFEKINEPRQFASNILFAIAIQIARSVSSYFASNAAMSLSSKWQTHFQNRIYAQILKMSFSCASQYKTGDLVDSLKLPSTAIPILFDNGNKALVSGFAILVLLSTMCFLSPMLTLLAALIFGGLGILQRAIIGKVSSISIKYQSIAANFSSETVQTLQGLRAIFTFYRQKEMSDKASQILAKMAHAVKKMFLWNNTIIPINEICSVLLVGIFLVIGLQTKISGTLPMLMTFVVMIYRLNGRMQALFSSAGSIAQQWGQLSAIQEILKDSDKEFIRAEGNPIKSPIHALEFKQVSLRYPGKSKFALQGITFCIPKGKMTAVVGPSGAGKSSILDLILGLYAPTSGQIVLDGQPLESYEMSTWRRRLGVVSQEVFIFHDTIEENIRFGMNDLAKEEVLRVAKLAGASIFIEKLPQNYQTVVGERGHRLSGGEKQRIALARALLRNPEILLLDEATSSLDSESELQIKKMLQELKGQKTLIVVAHRLSTISDANNILILNQGRIEAEGTHHELLQQQGLYSSLWKIQTQKEDIELSNSKVDRSQASSY